MSRIGLTPPDWLIRNLQPQHSPVLNHQGTALLMPRLLDSLMGCGIALVAGYLLWPESWHTRVGDRLADAVADTARYVESAFGAAPDPAARARMRRRLYRDLSVIRTEFQRALTEPPPTGRRAAAWWPLVVAVERIVDATTAARVRVRHGAARGGRAVRGQDGPDRAGGQRAGAPAAGGGGSQGRRPTVLAAPIPVPQRHRYR
ncbi:hypothetical protein M2157_004696 [Streptomyces sp. SAI-127]|nr:hypothetical protein [Streptomyces sp. SAI-127]